MGETNLGPHQSRRSGGSSFWRGLQECDLQGEGSMPGGDVQILDSGETFINVNDSTVTRHSACVPYLSCYVHFETPWYCGFFIHALGSVCDGSKLLGTELEIWIYRGVYCPLRLVAFLRFLLQCR